MTNKIFNFLRFMAETGITAIGAFYLTIAGIWGLPFGDEISQTLIAVSTLLGIFVGVKRLVYNYKNNNGIEANVNPEAEELINGNL